MTRRTLKLTNFLVGPLLLTSLGGCAQTLTRDFSPPPGGEAVSVTVKVPKDLAANTMRVMYRSGKCPISQTDSSGERYEIDGAHAIEVVPQRQGQSDLYEAKLSRDGGGACQWKLSNVTFGVHYENTSQFGDGVKFGGGGEIIVIFDENLPQQQSMYGAVDVDGDVLIAEDYFPWMIEIYLNGHRKILEIYGPQKFLTYRSLNAQRVKFEPRLHVDMVVRTNGVKNFGNGEQAENIYPDGSRVITNSDPNIEHLKKMADN